MQTSLAPAKVAHKHSPLPSATAAATAAATPNAPTPPTTTPPQHTKLQAMLPMLCSPAHSFVLGCGCDCCCCCCCVRSTTASDPATCNDQLPSHQLAHPASNTTKMTKHPYKCMPCALGRSSQSGQDHITPACFCHLQPALLLLPLLRPLLLPLPALYCLCVAF